MTNYEELYNDENYKELLQLTRENLDTNEGKYWHAYALVGMNRYERGEEMANTYLNKIDDEYWSGKFIDMLGQIAFHKRNYQKAYEYYDQSIEIWDKLGKLEEKATSLFNIGFCKHMEGDLEETIKYFKSGIEVQKQAGGKKKLAQHLLNLGVVYQTIGELNESLKYFKESEKFSKEIGYEVNIGYVLKHIGDVLAVKGELAKALETYKKSLNIRRKINRPKDLVTTLVDIGDVYKDKKEYQKALNYYQESLEISETHDLFTHKRFPLLGLIEVNLLLEKLQTANSYLEELQKLSPEKENRFIQSYQKFGLGLVKKHSKRMKDKVQAQEIFEQIISEKYQNFDMKLSALRHLIELLIFEYKTFSEEVFQEIKKYNEMMLNIAEKENVFSTKIDAIILQAKLAIVEYNFDKALELIKDAMNFADKKGLDTYKKIVENERKELMSDIQHLKKEIDSSSVVEEIEKEKIFDYIEFMKQNKSVKD